MLYLSGNVVSEDGILPTSDIQTSSTTENIVHFDKLKRVHSWKKVIVVIVISKHM